MQDELKQLLKLVGVKAFHLLRYLASVILVVGIFCITSDPVSDEFYVWGIRAACLILVSILYMF